MAHDSTPENSSDDARENTDEARAQIEFLRGLAEIVRRENLSEIDVEQDGVRVTLKAASSAPPQPAAPEQTFAASHQSEADEWDDDFEDESDPMSSEAASPSQDLIPVVSPMVGVFYRAQSPEDPPFAEMGATIEIGQPVGLVEAMKTFNEIVSEVEGIVVEIPIENGTLVETGTPLILLKRLG